MEYQTLLVETGEDHVGSITLNRPGHMNTFNTTMARELVAALLFLDADPETRVIVLKGAGKAFCAGIDITEFEGKTPTEYKAWVEEMENGLVTMMSLGKPVITLVRGVAAANGAGLIAASDLTVASENARIGFTAINVGLFCLGPAVPLIRAVGRKQALELLYFGDLITVEKAKEMGLVNVIAPRDELEKIGLEYARALAAKSPAALRAGKQACHRILDMELHQAFDYMNEAFARLCTTADAREGVAAFLEKRRPEWTGR
ncbi:MAG: enoyl-CoA hydratase-related protein [Pseudomonadota bacterium]